MPKSCVENQFDCITKNCRFERIFRTVESFASLVVGLHKSFECLRFRLHFHIHCSVFCLRIICFLVYVFSHNKKSDKIVEHFRRRIFTSVSSLLMVEQKARNPKLMSKVISYLFCLDTTSVYTFNRFLIIIIIIIKLLNYFQSLIRYKLYHNLSKFCLKKRTVCPNISVKLEITENLKKTINF